MSLALAPGWSQERTITIMAADVTGAWCDGAVGSVVSAGVWTWTVTRANDHVVTFVQPSGPLARVAKTGQTMSFAVGDDGDLKLGVALPTPRFNDNGDGTVTDRGTGLIWLKSANAFGPRTWNQALADCAILANGQKGLTDGSSAGQWRLPNREELYSLVDISVTTRPGQSTKPQLSIGHPFLSVQTNYGYWSSTTCAAFVTSAWKIGFTSSYMTRGEKNDGAGHVVWPVRNGPIQNAPVQVPRSGAGNLPGYTLDSREDGTSQQGVVWPVPRFADLGDGTVKDKLTGLIWLRNADHFGLREWREALADCNKLAHGQAGLTDGSRPGQWRLPNIRELKSLVCARYDSPALTDTQGTGQWKDGDPFSSVQLLYSYWTSSAVSEYLAQYKRTVTFGNAVLSSNMDWRGVKGCVWPVRGGLEDLDTTPSAVGMLEEFGVGNFAALVSASGPDVRMTMHCKVGRLPNFFHSIMACGCRCPMTHQTAIQGPSKGVLR